MPPHAGQRHGLAGTLSLSSREPFMNERRPFIVSLLFASLAHALLLALLLDQGTGGPAVPTGVTLTLAAGEDPVPAVTRAADPPKKEAPRAHPARRRETATLENPDSAPPSPASADTTRTHATQANDGDAPADSGAATPTDSAARFAGGTDRYLEEVRRIISARQHYPEEAARRRIEGRVRVSFVIGSGGRVVEVAIIEGSGSRLLDRATERMFAGLAFPPPPAALGGELALTIPLNWELN